MLEQFLVNNLWLSLLLFIVSYLSDYYLTIRSARLYRAGAAEHIVFEGSYELTPQYQRDIDALHPMSRALLIRLFLGAVGVSLVWLLTVQSVYLPQLFALLLGALLLREAAVHMRHFRNLALFRAARTPGTLQGQVAYARRTMLTQSSVEVFSFAGLFLFCALVTGSWFMLGGVLSCAITGLQHARLAQRVPLPKAPA